MDCKWIVENHVFDDDLGPLITEIRKQGLRVKEIGLEYYYGEKRYEDIYAPNECVIVYGSLQLCSQLKRMPWYPSVWCTLENYKCTTYYSYWGKYLLNGEYIMLPFNELHRRLPELFELLGQENTLFIRPDDGYKSFTGALVHKENYEDSIKLMESSIDASIDKTVIGEPKSSLVIVAPPKNILKEWRFIVGENTVLTGSQYRENGKLNIQSGYPQEAFNLAQEIVNSTKWRPDTMFSLDICQTNGGYYLLEIGAFSSSGMYKSDFSKIVPAASELALKEWKEVN